MTDWLDQEVSAYIMKISDGIRGKNIVLRIKIFSEEFFSLKIAIFRKGPPDGITGVKKITESGI